MIQLRPMRPAASGDFQMTEVIGLYHLMGVVSSSLTFEHSG